MELSGGWERVKNQDSCKKHLLRMEKESRIKTAAKNIVWGHGIRSQLHLKK